jgi:hypothetical protein
LRISLPFLILSAVVPASLVHAQARIQNVLQTGSRVRYEIPRASRPFTGIVEQLDSAGFSVRPDGLQMPIHLGLDSLRSLAVFDSVRSVTDGAARGALAGLRLGLILGAVITTAVWLSPADERCDACFISATVAAAQLSIVGTLGFGLLGGLIGAASPGEIWHDIPLRSLRNGNRR